MSASVNLKEVTGVGMPDATNPECALLGGILLNPESIWEVAHLITAADFSRAAHGCIWTAMLALAQRNDAIEMITLVEELTSAGVLSEAGGHAYVLALNACLPASGNTARYAKSVADAAAKRRLAQAANAILEDIRSGAGTVDALLDRAGQKILDATQRQGADGPVALKAIVKEVFADLEKRHENQGKVTGLSTGLTDLDEKTTGMHAGELILVAGRPGSGKTSLAMGIAEHVCFDEKKTALVFSLEMTKKNLVERMFSHRGRVDSYRIRTGCFEGADWPKMAHAADAMFRSKMEIIDTPGISILRLRQECRKFKARNKSLDLIVVDYVQLMRGSSGDSDNREQEVAEISKGLKEVAKEMDCPVIALAQLNRAAEKRADQRPVLSDLRESGSLEQDADVVVFVYRDEMYNKDEKNPARGTAELIIGKQRNGSTGTVTVAFRGEYTRFENLASGSGGGWG